MALDFLTLVPTVASLYSAYKSSQPTAAEQAQAQALANQQYYQQQEADPNSTLMQGYTNANKDMLDRQFAGTINDLVNANRRQTLLGRQPLFDPERGDQQILRAQNLGFQQNADIARQQAGQTIAGLASGSGSLASGYGNTVANAQKRQTQQNYLPVNEANAGTSILSSLFNKPQPTAAAPAAQGATPAATPEFQSPRFSGGYTPTTGYGAGGFNIAGLNY